MLGGSDVYSHMHTMDFVGPVFRAALGLSVVISSPIEARAENVAGLRRLADETVQLVEQFYTFLLSSKTHVSEDEFCERMPRLFDVRRDAITYETWILAHEYLRALIPQSYTVGSRPSLDRLAGEVLVGFGGGLQPLEWGEEWRAWLVLSSPMKIGEREDAVHGFKQVMFVAKLGRSPRMVLERGMVNVNGVFLFDDMWNRLWFEIKTYARVDLWKRFGISVPWEFPVAPFSSRTLRVVAGIRSPWGLDPGPIVPTPWSECAGSNTESRLRPPTVQLSQVSARLERTPEQLLTNIAIAVACAKSVVALFYENLLNDRTPEQCPDLFVATNGKFLESSMATDIWRVLKKNRWWFIDPGFLTNSWVRPNEALSDMAERPYLVLFRSPLGRRKWTENRFFLVYRFEPPTPPEDPLWLNAEPRTMRLVWFPFIATRDGYRIVIDELMVNGICVKSLVRGNLPPYIDLWRALGFND